MKTYREDFGSCVDTIKECSLIPFVSSLTALDTVERIPSVFLPLQGQIVYPNKELLFLNDNKCVIVSANYMTQHGWSDVKNSFNSNDIPFRLFLDKNRTFLQWSGDSTYRSLLQGRLVILRLACWNGSAGFQNDGEETVKIKNLSPCISFRVSGNLLKFTSNITEVQFALESNGGSGSNGSGSKEQFSTNEYLIIAISSFCLGLMYIASVALYIYLKRKKDNVNGSSSNSIESDKNFTRGDVDIRHQSFRQSSLLTPSIDFIEGNQANVIKNNPLVSHFMGFNENNAFVSDSSVDEDEGQRDEIDLDRQSPTNLDNECLPISITEVSENKEDHSRSFQNGPPRRKLYFNPAYFEPELLASPPPAAVEFLTKIREVISMAKNKMAAKKFHPTLNYISEEDSQKAESEPNSQNNTLHSKKSAHSSQLNTAKDSCAGCPGCMSKNNNNLAKPILKRCTNCGDKNNIIQKWLENVSTSSNETTDNVIYAGKVDDKRPLMGESQASSTSSRIESIRERIASPSPSTSSKSVKEEIAIVKGFVKEKNIFVQLDRKNVDETIFDSDSIPKIVSHSLKKNIKEMIYSQNFVRDKVNVFERKKENESDEKIETATHEIYNNPKFQMDQEPDSSAKAYSAVVKRKPEVLDQYSNPIKSPIINKQSVNKMPDMIYEAIEMEKKNNKIIDESPTPDYSSEYEMTKFKRYDGVSFAPFVPTPDYYTYGRNYIRNMKQYQPDSPIYSRKSPAYLVVDYETDSLERLNTLKKRNSSTPTSRSDISSSQPSPSSALPMEEEVEIRNALYDKEEGFRKDTDTIRKEREIDIQMRKTKIKYNTPNEGSMTIELEGISPDENNDATSSTDSDDFEPDTLDRHAKADKIIRYKAKQQEKKMNESFDFYEDKGSFLTLNFRQSKRQRNSGEASLKKLPNSHKISNTKSQNSNNNKSIPPDVISSSFKKSFHEIPHKKTMDEHSFKKSLVSAPIQFASDIEMDRKFISMDFPNDYHNRNSIIKTINHVKIPDPSPKFSDAFNENMRKTWKRFVGMAFKKHEEEDDGNKNIKTIAATEIEQGKVKNLIKKLNIVHVHDSGYLSSESLNNNENVSKSIESKDANERKVKNFKTRPLVPPPPVPKSSSLETSFMNNKNYEDLINITIYSSDDQNSSLHESDNEDERRIGEEVEDVGADSDFSFVQ
ncbi:hypothetical protein PVAND_005586 [Polypedilum vanderplanki]|nr:hypothetical protein PVAND_005586 [Polypedilum vanderplanki]